MDRKNIEVDTIEKCDREEKISYYVYTSKSYQI